MVKATYLQMPVQLASTLKPVKPLKRPQASPAPPQPDFREDSYTPSAKFTLQTDQPLSFSRPTLAQSQEEFGA